MPKYHVPLVVDVSGPSGNAWAIMGSVRNILKQLKVPRDEIEKYGEDARAGDFAHLLKVTGEWVELELINSNEDDDDDET